MRESRRKHDILEKASIKVAMASILIPSQKQFKKRTAFDLAVKWMQMRIIGAGP
jgi:hypothetical protein